VKRASEVSAASFDEVLGRAGYPEAEGLLVPQWWRVCARDPQNIATEVQQLLASPHVLAAEEEGRSTLSGSPNDTYYGLQWGLPRIGAPAAWDVTVGSSDVLVAAVDSGFDYTHPDAPNDLWLGWDFGDGDDDPYDIEGHGTHVLGIAAAATNNAEGVAGLCPGCAALTIKVSDSDGVIWDSYLCDGIEEAAWDGAYLGKRTVINISIGGAYSPVKQDAIEYAQGLGALVIASAGNGGPGTPWYPAALPGVIAVTATDGYDSHAPFSQYGDIGAPGVEILSTVPLWAAAPPYASMPGTSMASPLVAGAAGLVWSAHPEYTPMQVRFALYRSVDVPTGWDRHYGIGRLDVAGAVTGPPVVIHNVYLPLAMR